MSEEDPIVCPLVKDADFRACDPAELEPLLEALRDGQGASVPKQFPRGTLLPDGRLDLCKQSIGPEGVRLVTEALTNNRHVKSLLLGMDGLGNEGVRHVASWAEGNPDLHTIFLGCNQIDGQGIVELAKSLADHPRIRGLWLKRNPIGLAGAKALAELLARNASLRTLDLVNTNLGAQGLAALFGVLPDKNDRIERIYLGGNKIDNSKLDGLIRYVSRTSALRMLFLNGNLLEDKGTVALSHGLRSNSSLEGLALASNGIGAIGFDALLGALFSHSRLRLLDLGYWKSAPALGAPPNHLDGRSVLALAAFLRGNRRLSHLDLTGHHFSEADLELLLDALEQNTTLVKIELGGNLPHECRERLRTLMTRNRVGADTWKSDLPDEDVAAVRSVYRA